VTNARAAAVPLHRSGGSSSHAELHEPGHRVSTPRRSVEQHGPERPHRVRAVPGWAGRRDELRTLLL